MFYSIVRLIFNIIFSILFRVEVINKDKIPSEGQVILASNHVSNWDPPMLGTYSSRPVAYMAKEELFHPAIAGKIISGLYAFPVKRGAADRGAIKVALGILKKGLCLGVFPEGTRSKTGKLGKPQSGVSMLAAMGKAPVVPVALINTDKMFSKGNLFPKVKIVFGDPIIFERKHNDKEAMEKFATEIMHRIQTMLDDNR